MDFLVDLRFQNHHIEDGKDYVESIEAVEGDLGVVFVLVYQCDRDKPEGS